MKAIITSVSFIFCFSHFGFAQQQNSEKPTADPVPQVKPGTNPNKKVVTTQKEVVFSEKLEWIKVDSTSGKKAEITTQGPVNGKPKK